MERPDRRQLYQGFGDGLTRAFELALVPAIFGAAGYGLDLWLGLVPVLTIFAVLLALVGCFARMWYAYDGQMRAHEADGPWSITRAATPPVE